MFGNSIGFEILGNDLRVAIVTTAFRKRRLVASEAVAGFMEMDQAQRLSALKDLVRKHKMTPGGVYLGLPGDRGVIRQVELPVEIRDRLPAAVALQLEALSPWPSEETYWDYSVEPSKSDAKVIVVSVVIISREALDPWLALFKSAGLPLSGASLSPLLNAHGSSVLWTDNKPTIVLACASSSFEGAIVRTGFLSSLAVPRKDSETSARTVIDRLLSLGRVSSPDSVRFIAYGNMEEVPESDGQKSLPIENTKPDSIQFFGALTAALAAVSQGSFKTNFIPRSEQYRRNQLALIPTYVLVALTVLMGGAMAFREPYQATVYSAQLNAEVKILAPQVREVASQESELNLLSEKYRALTGDIAARDVNLEAMRELSRVLPPTVWLTSYNYQKDGISISGFAQSASEVQKAVEDSPLFKDAQFSNSVVRDSNGKDRFSLKASIEVAK